MSENTIHLDIDGLTGDEVDAAKAAAAALGAELEELSVTQNAEDFFQNAPVVITVLTPFLKVAAQAAAPKLAAFLKRALGRRAPRTIHLTDHDLYLEWTEATEKHTAEAIEAIRTLDTAPFAPGSVLYFDVPTSQWRPRSTS
ncbi:hypothetical protein [Actinoplanes sp. TFC3]|uniref:hypothetical protein n=1 Tax=Actinoplanes sp. TFC3 TaxID=1710355 RepID=UPI00082FA0F7|nr:hypothetical protein [Actinoplanes sp. TFC3]